MVYEINCDQFAPRGNETDVLWADNRTRYINGAANALVQGIEAFNAYPKDICIATLNAIRKYPDAFDSKVVTALNALFADQIS